MSRREFPVSVRKAAYARSGGVCECGCGRSFGNHPKTYPHYDHELPDFLGGANDLENCKVLRVDCHQTKTAGKDMPHIVKARRGQKERKGFKRRGAIIPGSKGSGLRKLMNGDVLRVKE